MSAYKSKYDLEIYDPTGKILIDFADRAVGRQMSLSRNEVYTLKWDVDIKTLEQVAALNFLDPNTIIASGQNEVRIRRGNVYLFGGQLLIDDGTLDIDGSTMQLQASNWLQLFDDRTLDQDYSYVNWDIGAIMWDLINNSQLLTNGDFGVRQGIIQPSITISKDFTADKTVKSCLVELSKLQGAPDMEFAWNKLFNVYAPTMGVVRNQFEFSYPGNITKLQVTRDATGIANYIKAKAGGSGVSSGSTPVVVQDTTVQGNYRLRQKVENFNDIVDSAILNSRAAADLAIMKVPSEIVKLTVDGNRTPYIGDYWLGDKIKLLVSSKWKTYNRLNGNFYQIDKMDISIDEEDSETITITGVKYG